MIIKALLTWLPMLPLAILNAVIREKGYGRHLSELAAHQISTVTAAILFGIYIGGLAIFWPLQSATQALTLGLIWLVLTVSFEFLFGHYVAKHSWSRLLQDYNLLVGRVWSLLLAWITIAPWVFYHLLGQ